MLYEKNKAKTLSPELFRDPTSEYRGTPFWAWNCELSPELLKKEIVYMKEMGFGGFHMHPRVGMATPYLTDEYMDLVGECVEKARDEKMLAWLYDEDKWPSGYAGGYVTKNTENRQKYLFLTETPYNDGTLVTEEDKSCARSDVPNFKYYLLACFDVILDGQYFIKSYKKISLSDKAEGRKLFAYVEYSADDPWYNDQAYCDTLSKPVVEEFIKTTHERYKARFGEEFGKMIPAIFTDEPQFARKRQVIFSSDRIRLVLPWTTDFDDTYRAAFGESITDHIPELVWDLPDGKISVSRYHYHDHIAERFVSAFSDTVGAWCKKNDILLTGHVMDEPSLYSQTRAVGDAMRSYRGFGMPGIDMLSDRRELTTAKQAQSAAHQYGCPGVLSELYGVTNWTFDFRGHKLQGDWQAALGITVRVPHLFWVSMKGEAKRDYPAAIGYQSPWYKEYKYVEDHFARVNTLMTRGVPDVDIAVIHPVESYWLHWGPNDKTETVRGDMEKRFSEITDWLLYGDLDFDFVCESLLASQFDEHGDGFAVGKMNYKAVVVPYCETIRSTTLDALEKFAGRGGKVIFMGEPPKYIDAVPSDRAARFAEKCTLIPWSRAMLYGELGSLRTVDIRNENGDFAGNLIYQSRIDGDRRNIFIAHVEKPKKYDIESTEKYTITFPGEVKITEYDTLSGEIKPMPAKYVDGSTKITWTCGACSSLLLSLEAGRGAEISSGKTYEYTEETLSGYVDFKLSEPNVLMLDTPAYSVNGGEMKAPKYVLFADNDIRNQLGIRCRAAKMSQPWASPYDKNPKDKVTLVYKFTSDIAVGGCRLALESSEYASVTFNKKAVKMQSDGWYVDEDSLKTFPIPPIKKGENTLVIEYRFGNVTQLEACFILGDFGTKVCGSNVFVTKMPAKLGFDDITSQGLAFYGGNVTYLEKYTSDGDGNKIIEINKYRGSVITVDVDGRRAGTIAYPPYRLPLGKLPKGEHEIAVTIYGNRMNSFGTLHNVEEDLPYCSPHRWRDEGRLFTPEYLLVETGILNSPRIITEKEKK